MIARATVAEIDFLRMSLEESVDLFRDSVIAALQEQISNLQQSAANGTPAADTKQTR